ncbi:MAG: hypothetical protein M3Y03_06805 [Verrucomicrobiota bacterium]|nr:hypothetical protein [Verrucomicrobiota bacterium]
MERVLGAFSAALFFCVLGTAAYVRSLPEQKPSSDKSAIAKETSFSGHRHQSFDVAAEDWGGGGGSVMKPASPKPAALDANR